MSPGKEEGLTEGRDPKRLEKKWVGPRVGSTQVTKG